MELAQHSWRLRGESVSGGRNVASKLVSDAGEPLGDNVDRVAETGELASRSGRFTVELVHYSGRLMMESVHGG